MEKIYNDKVKFNSVKLPLTKFKKGPLGIEGGIQWDNGDEISEIHPFINAVDIDWNEALVGDGVVLKTTGDLLDYILSNGFSGLITNSTIANVAKTLICDEAFIKNLWSKNINTDYLTVNKAAHFFELVIDQMRSVAGTQIITAANCIADHVEYNSLTHLYRVYWRNTDPNTGKSIDNNWKINDLAFCLTFNVAEGQSQNIGNSYYWRLVTNTSNEDGIRYVNLNTGNVSLSETKPDFKIEFSEYDSSVQLNLVDNIWTPKDPSELATFSNFDGITTSFSFTTDILTKLTIKTHLLDGSILYSGGDSYENAYSIVAEQPIVKIDINAYIDKWEPCNWIDLSDEEKDANSTIPTTGDNICQLGYRYQNLTSSDLESLNYESSDIDDRGQSLTITYDEASYKQDWLNAHTEEVARASAIIIAAYATPDSGIKPPSYAQYQYITDFDLPSHRKTYFDATGAHFVGTLEAGSSIDQGANVSINVETWRILANSTVITKGTNNTYKPNSLKLSILHNNGETSTILTTFGDLDGKQILINNEPLSGEDIENIEFNNYIPNSSLSGNDIEEEENDAEVTILLIDSLNNDKILDKLVIPIIKLNVTNGTDGINGTGKGIQFIYKYATTKPNTPLPSVASTPSGWQDRPTPPENLSDPDMVCWMSQRVIIYNGNSPTYHNWEEPILISGKNGIGEDGGDIEFIYYLTNEYTGTDGNIPPLILYSSLISSTPGNTVFNGNFLTLWQDINSNITHTQSESDYLPPSGLNANTFSTNWTDNPTGVDYNHLYEWVSVRYKKPGETWGEFTTPSLWAKYGVNGTKVEYIYKRFSDSQTWSRDYNNPKYWPTKEFEDDYLGPENYEWNDNPLGVTPEMPFEYVSLRIYEGLSWTEFTEPVIWSHWGSNGEDGDGVEYIFKHFEEEVEDWSQIDDNDNPATWLESNSPEEYLGPEGHEWSDNPLGVGSFIDESTNEEKIFKYEYVSIRKYRNGEWGTYSEPVLWTRLGQDGGRYYMLYKNAQEKPIIENRTTTPKTVAEMLENNWKTVNDLEDPDFANGYYTYMTQTFLDTPDAAGIWSDPLRISGSNGEKGADGEDGVNGKLWKLSPLKTDFLVRIDNNPVNYDDIIGSLYVNLEFGVLYIDGDTSLYVLSLTGYKIKLITDNTVENNIEKNELTVESQFGLFTINSIPYTSLTYQHNNYLQYTSGLEPEDEGYLDYTNYYYLHLNSLSSKMPTRMTVVLYKNDILMDTYTIPLVFKPDNLFSVTEAALNSIYQGFTGDPSGLNGNYITGFSQIHLEWDNIGLSVSNVEKLSEGNFPEDITGVKEYVFFRTNSAERLPTKPTGNVSTSDDISNLWTSYRVEPTSSNIYVFYTFRTKSGSDWDSWQTPRIFSMLGAENGYINTAQLLVTAGNISSTIHSELYGTDGIQQTFNSQISLTANQIRSEVENTYATKGDVSILQSSITQRPDEITFNVSKILNGEFPVDTEYELYIFLLSLDDITITSLSEDNFAQDICNDENCTGEGVWTTKRPLEPNETYKYLWYSRRTRDISSLVWNAWEYPVLFWEYGKQRGIVQNNHNLTLTSDGLYQTITDETNGKIASFTSTINGFTQALKNKLSKDDAEEYINTYLNGLNIDIPQLDDIVNNLKNNNDFIGNIVATSEFKNTLEGLVHDNSVELFGEDGQRISNIEGKLTDVAGSFQSLLDYETWINGQKEEVTGLISNIPGDINLTVTKAVNDKFTETGIDIQEGNINLVADKTTFGTSVKGEGDTVTQSLPMIAILMCNEDNEVDPSGTIPSIVFYSGKVNDSTPMFILNYLGLNLAVNNAVPQTWTTYSIKPAILIEENKHIIHAEALISSLNNPPIADEDKRYGWGEYYEDTPYTNIYKYNAAFYTDKNGDKVFSLTAGANLDLSFWENKDLNAARLPNTDTNNKLEGYFVINIPNDGLPEDFPITLQPRGRRLSSLQSEPDVNILIQQGLISADASIDHYTLVGNIMINTVNPGDEPVLNGHDYTISSGTHSNTGNSGISNVFSSEHHQNNYLLFKLEKGRIMQYTEFYVDFYTLISSDGTHVFLDTMENEIRRSKIIINTSNGSREGLWMDVEYMLNPSNFEQNN